MWQNFLNVWKKGLVFKGRSRRLEFWLFQLSNFLLQLAFGFVALAFILITGCCAEQLGDVGKILVIIGAAGLGLLYLLWFFGNIVVSLMLSIRRFHDVGLSGFFLLLSLLPCVGLLFVLFVSCIPGTIGPNSYGPDPKENLQEV